MKTSEKYLILELAYNDEFFGRGLTTARAWAKYTLRRLPSIDMTVDQILAWWNCMGCSFLHKAK
jgi:hypothetical protein